jgi:hypothetical protein
VKRSMGHGRIVGLDGKRELVHSTEGGDFYALSVSVFLNGKPECCFCGCRVCWGCFAETVESPPETPVFPRPPWERDPEYGSGFEPGSPSRTSSGEESPECRARISRNPPDPTQDDTPERQYSGESLP